MKKIIICLLIIGIALLVGYSMLTDFIAAKVSTSLKEKFSLESKIGFISLGFLPLSADVRKLDFYRLINNQREDFFKLKRLSVSPSVITFFSPRIMLNSLQLIQPELTIVRYNKRAFNLNQIFGIKKRAAGEEAPKDKKSFLAMELTVRDGRIYFVDRYLDPHRRTIELAQINIDIKKVSFPLASLKTEFEVSLVVPSVPGRARGGSELSGWIEPVQKDMDAELKVVHLDLAPLAPYCTKFVTSGIESGILYLDSDIRAVKNELNAQCHLEVHDLKFKSEGGASGMVFGVPVQEVVKLLQASDGKLILEFEVKGKLDAPQVDKEKIINEVLNRAMENLLRDNFNKLFDQLKGAGEYSKEKAGDAKEGIEEGLEKAGEKLKETLEQIFR